MMPTKTTILIIVLSVITGLLIFLALSTDNDVPGKLFNLQVNQNTKVQPTVSPFATLSFVPSTLNIPESTTATQSVNIEVDTKGMKISGVQIELSYDPLAISNVKLTPSNEIFGPNSFTLINSVNPTEGRISYAVGISPDDSEKTGKGIVATLTFQTNIFAASPATQITFLPQSSVTTLATSRSVLKDITPLQIILRKL